MVKLQVIIDTRKSINADIIFSGMVKSNAKRGNVNAKFTAITLITVATMP